MGSRFPALAAFSGGEPARPAVRGQAQARMDRAAAFVLRMILSDNRRTPGPGRAFSGITR